MIARRKRFCCWLYWNSHPIGRRATQFSNGSVFICGRIIGERYSNIIASGMTVMAVTSRFPEPEYILRSRMTDRSTTRLCFCIIISRDKMWFILAARLVSGQEICRNKGIRNVLIQRLAILMSHFRQRPDTQFRLCPLSVYVIHRLTHCLIGFNANNIDVVCESVSNVTKPLNNFVNMPSIPFVAARTYPYNIHIIVNTADEYSHIFQ